MAKKMNNAKKNIQRVMRNYGTINQDVVNIILPIENDNYDFIITQHTDTTPTNNFLGRMSEIEDIKNHVKNGDKLLLVSGMGGIGKTHLCRYLFRGYIKDYKENTDIGLDHIGYLNYSDSMDATLISGLKMVRTNDNETDIKIAWAKLADLSESKKILLIVDNVDKTMNEDETLKKLFNINCAIIITTRKRGFERFIPFELGLLSYNECKVLFEKIFGEVNTKEQSDLKYILETLAGKHTKTVEILAYMAKTKGWSIKLLRDKLESQRFNISLHIEGKRIELQKEYEKLFNLASLTKKETIILEAFSLFAPLALPLPICDLCMNADAHFCDKDEVYFKLYSKGWLEKNEDGYYMHPIIGETVFNKFKPSIPKHKNLIKHFISFINIQDNNNYIFAAAMISYTESIIKKLWDNKKSIFSFYANRMRCFYDFDNNYNKALEWAFYELSVVENYTIKKYVNTILIYNNLGCIYNFSGDFEEALQWHNKALEICSKKIKKLNLLLAKTYQNIGQIYSSTGKYKMALDCFFKSLSIQEKCLNEKYYGDLYEDIAHVYSLEGNFDISLTYIKKAIVISKELFGLNSSSTGNALNKMAAIYKEKGDYSKALILFYKALIINKKIIGEEHLDIGIINNNIALIYYINFNFDKALDWFYKALTIKESKLGEMHPITATTYNNIGNVFFNKNEYDGAIKWYNKALRVREKVLGKDHPQTAESYNNLGCVYKEKGEYNKALNLFNDAIRIYEIVFNSIHQDVVSIKNSIAELYMDNSEYNMALNSLNSALDVINHLPNKDHPNNGAIYNNLFFVYSYLGEFKKAIYWVVKAYDLSKFRFGPDHPNTKIAYNNALKFYLELGRPVTEFDQWINAPIINYSGF